jgi:4a-hydroxytetrahydrobiopterin dehydratase
MSDQITPAQFHESEGVDDWRVLASRAAVTCFRTGAFATGLALVDEIGRLAEEADHHPDVELRYTTVFVTLTSHDVGGLSRRDVKMARRISAAAKERGIAPDPGAVQNINVTVDALSIPDVLPFWQALLAYDEIGGEDLVSPDGRGPKLWFQQMDERRTQRNRVHLDVSVPHDRAEARIAAAIAAGGRLVTADHAPSWWVLADPEGNEVCVTTWQGRD